MQKSDLAHLLVKNFNVEPLKEYIRESFNPNFVGRRDDIEALLVEERTAAQLKAIVGNEMSRFQLDMYIYSLDGDVTFSRNSIRDNIRNTELRTAISALPNVEDVDIYDDLIVGYIRVPITGNMMRKIRDSWFPTPRTITVDFYVPFFIELVDRQYVKIAFAKFDISNGEIPHYSGVRIWTKQVHFNPYTYAVDVSTRIAGTIFPGGLSLLNLSESVRTFAKAGRLSALEFAWDQPDGERFQKDGKKNQVLFPYEYVNERIDPALDVLAAKWYITNPELPAENQNIRNLNTIRVDPAFGVLKVDKFQKESLREFINEFIRSAN